MRLATTALVTAALATGCASESKSTKAADTAAVTAAPTPAPETKPITAQKESPMQPPEGSKQLVVPPETFAATCQSDLDAARASIARLKSLDPKTQGDAVLAAYDEAQALMSNAGSRSSLAREVHPDAKMRDAARECEQKVEELNVEISQDRAVYDALAAVDLSSSDAPTKYWMQRTLLDFRRAGVDRDDATRAKVKALTEELVKLGQQFGKNIAEDVQKVELDPKELDGLPADYVKAHPPGKNGKVTITSNYPDYFPFMSYAKNAKAREKVWRMYRQRAYPANMEVLKALIVKRHELATLLGYPNWAAYVTETKMTRNEKTAADFIEKVTAVTEARAKKEYDLLLARKKKDDPKATRLEPWDQDYYEDRLKAETFGFDSQAVRPYFEYSRVKDGVMNITSRIFGITYERVKDAAVWHPSVEAYDVFEGDKLLGRIYLDMHPRDDKYKHAAQFDLVAGQAGKRYPEGVLVCNFPSDGELMTHDEVETFFHEFGHLLHHTFAGHQRWTGITGIRTEWDFVETPSMLLQEWPSQPSVLKEFAKHYQTGEPIPDALVQKLRASKEFGKGLWTRRQMFLSALALEYYRRPPGFDLEQVLVELQKKFTPFRHEWREGTHFELAFGHLDGYSAAYYTYIWSTVIAKDLETAFEKNGFLDPATATRYRKTVLDPGGSKPAAELVKEFLGRDYGFESYRAYLDRD
ncbi:MAG: Zn-dependent oligopeptidase [Myxococcaceae bacterium]|nr:Zn-dependent oligopeptidase [Myxococcaceae bacterium]